MSGWHIRAVRLPAHVTTDLVADLVRLGIESVVIGGVRVR
jgi:hypothetical protein